MLSALSKIRRNWPEVFNQSLAFKLACMPSSVLSFLGSPSFFAMIDGA